MCSENHMQKNDIVDKAMDALRQTPIPPGPPAQIASVTLAAVLENAKEPETLTTIKRIRTMKRITKFAAAAAIIIVIISLITWITPGDQKSGLAFADVIQPLFTAKNAIYKIVIGPEGKGPVIQDMVMGSRIRRTFSNMDSVSIIDLKDLETIRVLTLDPKKKKAVYVDVKGLPPQKILSYLDALRTMITDLQDSPAFVIEELGEKEINGRTAIGFRARHPKVDMTIWADLQTAMPIRIVQKQPQLQIIMTDFQFNVEMDESLFSMEVPQGYTMQETEMDLFASTEQDFIEGLRLWAEILLDGQFPASIAIEDLVKQAPMLKEKFDALGLSDEDELALSTKMQRCLLFIRFYKGQGKWHYAGKDVKLGDAEKAIFWYRPQGSQTYRVIYGDLSVKDAAREDLPQPPDADEETDPFVATYQQWSKTNFVGSQKDQWHITASGDIVAHSYINLKKGPQGSTTMPIILPYPSATLQSATCAEEPIKFSIIDQGHYELDLPLDQLSSGETNIECIWTVSLDKLEKVDYGYRTVLRSLIPATSYKLTIILEPDCNFQHTQDPSKRRFVPFSWGSAVPPKIYFGSCGITIQSQEHINPAAGDKLYR